MSVPNSPFPVDDRNVAIVAPWFFGGGAQAAVTALLQELAASGVQTKLIVLFAGSTGVDALRPHVSQIVELNSPKSPWGAIAAARALERHLLDADAVYSLMRGSHLVLGLRPAALIHPDRPLVATFHQLPSSDSRGAFGKLEDFFVRRAVSRASLITAPSKRAISELASRGFAEPERLVYEPNPLAPTTTAPVAPPAGGLSRVRLLFAGRLTSQKGLDQLDALLHGVGPSLDIRIAGSGPDEQRIREAAARVDERHSVTLIGEVDDVTPHIDWCDVLFMPSRSELNPVFLWEGRQRGRGAITSDIPAFQDLAAEGGILLVPQGASIADAVNRFAREEETRAAWFEELPLAARRLEDLAAGSRIIAALTSAKGSLVSSEAATSGVLVLHGYSADNAGDGLLVRETVSIIKEALGETPITLLASYPETFSDLNVSALPAIPTKRGWNPRARDALRQIDDFAMAIGVGGGYLRAGTMVETLKAALVHGPQLVAASKARIPTLYLPQSVGPARFGTKHWVRRRLSGVDKVMLRDDRSVTEFFGPTVERVPDLAAAGVVNGRRPENEVDSTPVLSIRAVRGRVSPPIYDLADLLDSYDGYVQSTTGGNDDRAAAATLAPVRSIERTELMASEGPLRVVVAVRLHAALMALAAGHYVIHLAYERKGFGAFEDLGIAPWVHSVNRFDAFRVAEQTRALLFDAATRDEYETRIGAASERIVAARSEIVERVREWGRTA